MTIGIGGSTAELELAKLADMTAGVKAVSLQEFNARIVQAQAIMQREGINAIYLNAGTNLYYFTGMRWGAGERLVGAILPAIGDVQFIAPRFEQDTINEFMVVKGPLHCWHEHENPAQLFGEVLAQLNVTTGVVGIDEATAFFMFNNIRHANPQFEYIDAKAVTAGCRQQKSDTEIALLQRAKDMTLEVHKAAARILRLDICTTEVEEFIHQAHKVVGAPKGSYFCIVLFGKASSFPHGVKDPQFLKQDDVVLIDTGCQLQGYNSDITRTYVFGEASNEVRAAWLSEKNAQQAAFDAAQINVPCQEVDAAARVSLEADGFGPGYDLPGLPHRTGHGIGLDIHEWPYLVGNDTTPLAKGMCFSNEPMLVIPGKFGIRLEDHFYMTDAGPKWFTQPSHSIDDPFGYQA
ncbi:M24 family metallopeptidase [Moritella marina]|uniref:M24 family metallopeptidase n=1 Tax=Moritella marina TaxID=90736 RepID=UPI0037037989